MVIEHRCARGADLRDGKGLRIAAGRCSNMTSTSDRRRDTRGRAADARPPCHGKLVERSGTALVVPRGQMRTNLLGMSFLDRLEKLGRACRLGDAAHGYP